MPIEEEERLGLTYWESAEMVKHPDVVTINCPLHPETEHLLDEKLLSTRNGAYREHCAWQNLQQRRHC